MELGAAGLVEQPFRIHGKPLVFVSYEAQLRANAYLSEICRHPTGLGLLQGPPLSGKSTLVSAFVHSLGNSTDVAIVNGTGLNTTTLLESILRQFGYKLKFTSVNELINMIKVFVLQRTASSQAPLLVIDNAQHLDAHTLDNLSRLATLRVRHYSALRMILISDRPMESTFGSPELDGISSRLGDAHSLGAMAQFESTDYLHEKLRAGGSADPDMIIPEEVCNAFHDASGGWPGILDRLVLLAFAKAARCPLSNDLIEYPQLPAGSAEPLSPVVDARKNEPVGVDSPPSLFLTKGGETLDEIIVRRPRLIVGRSEYNDLRIDSRFVSRHHAMFIHDANATLLMDLNSANGTFVNSRRISNQVLMHNDVISIGEYRIKFVQPGAMYASDFDDAALTETVILKNFQDMRRVLAQENTQSMPIPPLKDATEFDS